MPPLLELRPLFLQLYKHYCADLIKYSRDHRAFLQPRAIPSNAHYKLNITASGQHSLSCTLRSLPCIISPTFHMIHILTLSLLHSLRHCQALAIYTLSINHMGRVVSSSVAWYYSALYCVCLLDKTGLMIHFFLSLTEFTLSCYYTLY